MTFQSLNKLFFDRAEQYNEKPFLWAKKDKEWIPLTWNETSLKVKEFAGGLRSLGIKPCLLYTSPSPRDKRQSRMPSSA